MLYIPNSSYLQAKEFQYSFIEVLDPKIYIGEIVQAFLNIEIKESFIKIFTFEKELSNIHENEELLKILTNAAYKYQNLDIIAEKTYEFF